MGLILGDGVPLPASRGDSISRLITSNEGFVYFCFGCCAASTGGVVDVLCMVLFNDYKNKKSPAECSRYEHFPQGMDNYQGKDE
jgi:hypothetical protein